MAIADSNVLHRAVDIATKKTISRASSTSSASPDVNYKAMDHEYVVGFNLSRFIHHHLLEQNLEYPRFERQIQFSGTGGFAIA